MLHLENTGIRRRKGEEGGRAYLYITDVSLNPFYLVIVGKLHVHENFSIVIEIYDRTPNIIELMVLKFETVAWKKKKIHYK